jgi:hypothetical protein
MSHTPETRTTIQWDDNFSGSYTLKNSNEIIATGSFFLNAKREIQAITNEGSGIDNTLCMLHKLVQDGVALAPTVELTQGKPYESVFKSRASLQENFNPTTAPPAARPNGNAGNVNNVGVVTVHSKYPNYRPFVETAAQEERAKQHVSTAAPTPLRTS